MDEQQIIIYQGKTLYLDWGVYASNNQTSLTLMWFDDEMGMLVPYMTVTKNIEHVELEEDEIIVKNYSENEGILPVLIKAGIIAKPHETVSSGYVKLNICQLIN